MSKVRRALLPFAAVALAAAAPSTASADWSQPFQVFSDPGLCCAQISSTGAGHIAADGKKFGPVTISERKHSSTMPQLDVAPDGTAVAAWAWHDPTGGWRTQVAVRKPGEARFGAPQNLSEPTNGGRGAPRPWVNVAAGRDGRAVVSWQIGGDYRLPETPLMVASTDGSGAFSVAQTLGDAGGLAQVGLAVSDTGTVQVAYADTHFSGHEKAGSLHAASGQVGGKLSEPVVVAKGGKGNNSGSTVATEFNSNGSPLIAWVKPTDLNEAQGSVVVFTGHDGTFDAGQTLAAPSTNASGVVLATGSENRAVVAWMGMRDSASNETRDFVQAAVRTGGANAFGAAKTLSSPDRNALWPAVGIKDIGVTFVAWTANSDGSGGGSVEAADLF